MPSFAERWSGDADPKPRAPMADLPKPHELFKPTLEALIELGGLASIEEIEHRVAGRLGLGADPPDAADGPDGGAAVVRDRMAWARSGLKQGRFLENPRRGEAR